MKTFPMLLLATLAVTLAAPAAFAHGGQYRGPGGALPPELREPSDPTPPTPPPATGDPVTPSPSKPGDAPSRPAGPVTPEGKPITPTGRDPFTGGQGQPRSGGRATITPDCWIFWYEYNKDVLQQLKRGIYKFGGSNHPLGGMTGFNAGARSASRHATRALVRDRVIPALLWAMDPRNSKHQDTESAAYIALAKVSRDPQHVELLQRGLRSRNGVTRESAALALGLLRRETVADRFDAESLDRVRTFLFGVFEDESVQARTRGFAALSLGLLGDQPSGLGPDRGPAATTARLFDLLAAPYEHNDLPVALLLAISLQSRDSLTPAQFQTLRTCVTKERIGRHDVQPLVASYAALALGRIGDRDVDVHALLRAVGSRRSGAQVVRSAAIALGLLGRRCRAETRVQIAATLRDGVERKRIRDVTARNFAVVSLSYLIEADVRDGRTDVLDQTQAGRTLLRLADGGRHTSRAYGALALGLIARAIGDETRVPLYGEYRSRALEVLRAGLGSKRIDKRDQGAYAIALGLAQDRTSIGDLAARVADEQEDDELRGYAAMALGHIGNASEPVLRPIRKALASRRSEKLRRATASALGMLSDAKAVPLLLEELKRVRSQNATGQVVIALAKVGDERAIEPLVGLLRNPRQQDLTRALACAGLGIVGDLAWIPSLSRIGRDINYRASSDLVNEVLSIL